MGQRWPNAWRSMVAAAGLGLATSSMLLTAQETPRPDSRDSQPGTAQEKMAGAGPEKKAQPKDIFDLPLEQLQNVPVRPPTSTGSTTVITPTQEEAASQSTSQLLRQAPSVSLRRTSGLAFDPRVRGYHAGQINANASGMTQFRTRIDIDALLGQIDSGNVESLTVIDGPYTSLFGPGFAFISADLMQPKRYLQGAEHHASTLFSYGYNGAPLYHRDRVWGGGANWGYNISYGVRTGTDYASGDPHESDIPASYQQQDVFAALSFDLSACTRLDFNYLRVGLHNVELPGVAYDINRQTTDQFGLRWVMQDDPAGPEQAVVQLWWHRTPFNVDSTRESKQLTFFRTFLGQQFAEVGAPLANLFGVGMTESWGVRALRTYGGSHGPQLTFGADWRRLQQRYQETDIDTLGEVAFGGNIFGIPQSHIDDYGLLTHLKVPAHETLNFTLGGRVDLARASLDSNDIIAATPPGMPDGFFRPGFNEPTYLLYMGYGAAEWKPRERLTLNAGAGYGMRAPNLVELYNDEPYQPLGRFGNSYADGDSHLDPECNLQFDLGARVQTERYSLGVRGFHSMLHDYILAIPSDFSTAVAAGVAAPTNLHRDYAAFGLNPADPAINYAASTASLAYKYVNLARASITGAEMTAELQVGKWWTVEANVAYVKGVNHSPSRYVDSRNLVVPIKNAEALPGIYPLNSTIRLSLVEPEKKKWGVELVTRLVHGQEFVADSLGELPTPGFTVFDVHGFCQLNKNLRAYSSILNLLDRSFTEHGSLAISNPQGTMLRFVPERGFTWIVGIEARY